MKQRRYGLVLAQQHVRALDPTQNPSRSAKRSYVLGKCEKRAPHKESSFLSGKIELLLHESRYLKPSLSPLQTDHIISEHLQQPACLEVDPSHKALRVNACDSANPYQKWQFGNYYAD